MDKGNIIKLRVLLPVLLIMLCNMTYAQYNSSSFSKYHHHATFQIQENLDSLRKAYDRKFLLKFENGFHYIDKQFVSPEKDSVTFADFTSRRAYYRLGAGYSINRKSEIQLMIDFMILPQEQEITNISFSGSSISGEGRGSGGFMFGGSLGYLYHFYETDFTRYYISSEIGFRNLIAAGGEVSFTSDGGMSNDNINSENAQTSILQLKTGLRHRLTPVTMFDLSAGYLFSSEMEQIGRVTQINGFTFSIGLHFMLNPRKSNVKARK